MTEKQQSIPNDRDLISRVISDDDRNAFGAIYERYFPDLYLYARRLVPDDALASDIVQDCFIRFYTNLRKGLFSFERSHVRSYLFILLRHRAMDELRRHRAQRSPADFASATMAFEAPQAAQAQERESIDQITALLNELPPLEREVLVLRYLHALSSSEIAELLGISQKSVTHRAYKALSRLRHSLEAMRSKGSEDK